MRLVKHAREAYRSSTVCDLGICRVLLCSRLAPKCGHAGETPVLDRGTGTTRRPRLRRVWRVLVSGFVWVAQEISLVDQLESRRFDFLPKKRLFDAMQGAGFGDAGTRPTRVVGYDI